jgi:S-formylglutathione hydrolase FrmB
MIALLVPIVCFVFVSLAFSQRADDPAKAAAPGPAPAPPPAPATAPAASAPAAPTSQTMPEGCIIEKFDVASPSMKRQIHALVVLPPEYKDKPDKRYPVLFALHGMDAPYAVFSEMAPLRKALRERPMIVASFDCDKAGWYVDSPKKPGNQFQTFFFDELIPYVDSHYRTNGQKGVTGFSMGGFGAFHYMLCRPEMFASASSLSGAFFRLADANGRTRSGFLQDLMGDPSENRQAYQKLDINGRIEEYVKKGVHLPPMMIHCGTEDQLLGHNREMCKFLTEQNKLIASEAAKDPSVASETDSAKKARALDILMLSKRLDFQYIESPGAHNWIFWRGASENLVDFHWRSFRDAPKAGAPGAK